MFLKRKSISWVVAIGVLTTGFLALTSSQSANAFSLPSNDQIYDNLSAHQHYWWLVSCFDTSDIDKVDRSEVDGWGFFVGGGSGTAALGSMYPGESEFGNDEGEQGYRKCDNTGLVDTAFGKVGFKESRGTFCKITGKEYGGESVDEATCNVGSGGDPDHWDNGASEETRTKWFEDNAGPKKPPLGQAETYLRAYLSLTSEQGCKVKFGSDTLYDSADKVPDASADNKYAVPVVVQNGSGTLVKKYIQGIGSNGDYDIVLVATKGNSAGTRDGKAQTKNCNEVVNIARDNADGYLGELIRLGATSTIDDEEKQTPTGEETTTTCAIDGIGWIVCPVMTFMATIVDAAYNQIASWLTVAPLTTTTSDNKAAGTMYSAWSTMRNIANIAFVIGFMVIIYSQLTSVGISNYGIKKLLPKIMVAAILVNVSYWVCAAAVDVSNILGSSLYSLFDTEVYTKGISTEEFAGDVSSTGNGWTGIVATILASAGLYLALPALIVALPAALLAIVTVFLVLALRQVLIILLIVISPLAFVALLLPNTEDWFKRWRTLLQTLLLLYPIIAVIFGASAMASTIVMNSAKDIEGDGKLPIQIMGALITILPLAITPIIMKFGGGVLGRFGGMVNNPNKGPFDAMRKRSDAFAGRIRNRRAESGLSSASGILAGESGRLGGANSRRRRVAAAFRSGGKTMAINADEKDKYAKAGADAATRNYVANRANSDIGYATRLAGGDAKTATLVQSYAKQAVKEESEKDIKAHEVLLSGKTVVELKATVENAAATVEERAAAARMIVDKGGHQNVQDLYNYMMTNTDGGMEQLQQMSADSMLRRKPAGVGAAQANNLKTGNMTGGGYLDSFAQRIEDGKFGAQDIASMDVDDHVRIAEMAASGKLSDGALKQLSAQMAEIEASDTMKLTPEQERALTSATYRQPATKANGDPYNLAPLPPRPPAPLPPPTP